MPTWKNTLALACIAAGLHAAAWSQATLVSHFEFDGNLNDQLGNATATLINAGSAAYSGGELSWTADSLNPNGGCGIEVRIPDPLFAPGNYSIAIEFQFSEVTGYRKVIDFDLRTSDQGLYVNSELRIYSVGNYGPTTWIPDSTYTMLLTRNGADDSLHTYLFDGVGLMTESVGLDTSATFVAQIDSNNRVLGFFYDDLNTMSEFSRAGRVRSIRIWNGIATLGTLTGQAEPDAQAGFALYPNPARTQLNLRFPGAQSGTIDILDASGRLLSTRALQNAFALSLPIADLPVGLYIVRVGGKTARFVKE